MDNSKSMNFIRAYENLSNVQKIWMKLCKFGKFSFLKVVISHEDQMQFKSSTENPHTLQLLQTWVYSFSAVTFSI